MGFAVRALGVVATFLITSFVRAQAIARVPDERGGADALIERLEAAQMRFFYQWRLAFQQSDTLGMGSLLQLSQTAWHEGSRDSAVVAAHAIQRIREAYAHCNINGRGHGLFYVIPSDRFIADADGRTMFCPSWHLAPGRTEYDMRANADAGIDRRYLATIHASRDSLIALHERAIAAYPNNEWISGQLVRHLVDRGRHDEALAATHRCAARISWCSLLAGYVHASAGAVVAADAAFDRAIAAMKPVERCDWQNPELLLDPLGQDAFRRATCSQRDSLSRTLWWLADPLYTVPGNERRVEHFARRVAVTLRGALKRDERYPWSDERGRGALAALLIRYGQPSFNWWAWQETWDGLDVGTHYPGAITGSSYASFEYAGERVHTVPASRVLQAPLEARQDDWQVNDPGVLPRRASYRDDALARAIERLHASISPWWPREHIRARTPIVQLPEGQVAFLRRDTTIHAAMAIDLSAATVRRAPGTSVTAVMLSTTRPEAFDTIATGSGRTGATLALNGFMAPRRSLLALELTGGDSIDARGRTRFGINPPPSLAEMIPTTSAISDLVMMRAPDGDAEAPLEVGQVFQSMLGSPRIPAGSRLAVYWETYGIQPTDTVDVAVWIERHTAQGIVRRFGIALSVARDLNTPVAISWSETGVAARSRVLPGILPIVARSVVLDASALASGDYWLDVVVRARGKEPVRARRPFTVPPQ